ncbi:Bug family tripartite tricarboxylate transporter substrate binding protein [Falsiroseomonas selenitidurans]|uniref:Tripartite tricarboxylate transporter substrate binding protein n=1 Tax=Falsiroseomonas selenitidurans TaxID=2716335 RepID=A0ABX1E515_9PROT|nr:tripartite tricarboxylate transporter substrate binding protein [Falsiroseomonas selenitidurans]NKC30893.1 tripartite tricarboxylate transporter substrate binding protein [Falsiroseomonas selenitidurans]
MRLARRHLAGLGLAALATPRLGLAQPAWPSRPVRFIIPFPPGGAADLVGRMLAQHLQASFGQGFVVENRGGAGSAIGVDALAKAAPDGGAVGMINIAANAILPAVRKNPLPYRPIEDFAPVSNLAVTPALLLVNPTKLPDVKTVADLVARAKANPEAINFGSSGVGSSLHLGMELFMAKAGIRMTHVPFAGGGPLLQALLAGTIDCSLDVAATTTQLIREGRILALATTAPARMPIYPNLPALNEAYPGAELASWHGLAAPAGTPAPILARLATATQGFLQAAETRQRYTQLNLEMPQQTSPEAFRDFMVRELATFRDLARAQNIVVE